MQRGAEDGFEHGPWARSIIGLEPLFYGRQFRR